MTEHVYRGIKRLCYAGLDSVTLRREVAARIAPAVPFDAYAFGVTDPDTGLVSHMVAAGMPAAMAGDYVGRLYPFESAQYAIDAARRGRVVYLAGEESVEIAAAMRANGFGHGSHVVLASRRRLRGKWSLLSARASTTTIGRAHGLLRRLAPHLTRGLAQAAMIEASATASDDPGAGVVVLDARGRSTLQTESVRSMLDDLADIGVSYPDAIPLALLTVAARLRGQPGIDAVSVRAQGRCGRWYAIQACRPQDVAGSTVVVVRPLLSREVARMLTELYGLSPREREIIAAVARGLTTKEIAGELDVSPHTVKEHLDRACEKTGAHGRKALVARLFFDAYAPRLFDARPPA